MEYAYVIGDKEYIQKPLVIGQLEELIPLAEGVSFAGELTAQNVMTTMGDRLLKAVAVVLREKGVDKWWDRDTEALAEGFRYTMEASVLLEIVTDFFACNPLPSVLSKLAAMNKSLSKAMGKAPAKD